MIGVQMMLLALGKISESVRANIHWFLVHIFIEQLLYAKKHGGG